MQQRTRLDRETDRLNALRGVSHSLALRACHDIRSPLTVIKTFSSILLNELASAIDVEQARFLRTIMRRADDLGHMVDDILDASQLAADLVGSHREAVRIEDLVEELRPELEQTAAANDARLSIRLEAPLPDVFCDRGDIERVVHNLVASACKATGPAGTIEVWGRSEAEERSVRIGVSDNRPYESESGRSVETIVGPARRQSPIHGAKSRDPDLKLHVVSEMVRINLGKLSITAHPRGGSTSAFTVPLVDLDRILSAHLGVLESGRQTVSELSAALAIVTAPCSERHSREIVQFLWSELRSCDLVVPVHPGAWALCVSCNAGDFLEIVRRVERSFEDSSRSRPDGSLPALSLRIVGTWPISGPSEQVTDSVRRALPAGCGLQREPGRLDEGSEAIPTAEHRPGGPIHFTARE